MSGPLFDSDSGDDHEGCNILFRFVFGVVVGFPGLVSEEVVLPSQDRFLRFCITPTRALPLDKGRGGRGRCLVKNASVVHFPQLVCSFDAPRFKVCTVGLAEPGFRAGNVLLVRHWWASASVRGGGALGWGRRILFCFDGILTMISLGIVGGRLFLLSSGLKESF